MAASQLSATARAKFKPLAKGPFLDGTLTVTLSSVKWNPSTKNTNPVAIDASTITGFQQSKESSPKAMLKLNIAKHPQLGTDCIFEFESFPDRNRCSNLIKELLSRRKAPPAAAGAAAGAVGTPPAGHVAPPRAGQAIDTAEIERRMKALASDEELRNLHFQLVVGGILSEADFWSARKNALDKDMEAEGKQRTGVPTAMLAAVRPTMDGNTNTVSFTLTSAIVHQIFAEKPAVHQAYIANVGTKKMKEADFWTKYFKAEYKFQQRLKSKEKRAIDIADDEDMSLFTSDNNLIERQAKYKIKKVDPTLDIASDMADDYISVAGHGLLRRGEVGPEPMEPSKDSKHERNVIRDLNRHAAVVLEGRPAEDKIGTDTASIANSLLAQQMVEPPDTEDPELAAQRNERVHQMNEIPDLQPPPPPALIPLEIDDPRKYFDSGQPNGSSSQAPLSRDGGSQRGADVADDRTPHEAVRAFRRQLAGFGSMRVEESLPSEGAALEVLNEVTKRVTLSSRTMGAGAEKGLLKCMPDRLRTEILQRTAKSSELLRHFWSSYPITATFLAEKVKRLKPAISLEYDALEAYKRGVASEWRHQTGQLLKPLQEALSAAVQFYEEKEQAEAAKAAHRASNGAGQQRPGTHLVAT